jgi:hypothetical protein
MMKATDIQFSLILLAMVFAQSASAEHAWSEDMEVEDGVSERVLADRRPPLPGSNLSDEVKAALRSKLQSLSNYEHESLRAHGEAMRERIERMSDSERRSFFETERRKRVAFDALSDDGKLEYISNRNAADLIFLLPPPPGRRPDAQRLEARYENE